jgi:hypothetical protein
VPNFAKAKSEGLTFNINRDTIPSYLTPARSSPPSRPLSPPGTPLVTSLLGKKRPYFTVNDSGGARRPAFDGINTVGWLGMRSGWLAATWVWTDNDGFVQQADIFFNRAYTWGVFDKCDAQQAFEVGNVGTHEVGHTVGLDHLSDPNGYATMYPYASSGEVRKRTPTTAT